MLRAKSGLDLWNLTSYVEFNRPWLLMTDSFTIGATLLDLVLAATTHAQQDRSRHYGMMGRAYEHMNKEKTEALVQSFCALLAQEPVVRT